MIKITDRKVINIEWDTPDGEYYYTDNAGNVTSVRTCTIPDNVADDQIENWLINEFNCAVISFDIEVVA